MVSTATDTAHNIAVTTENLKEELHRLEARRRSLEEEMAAVVAHLGSVQQALQALENLKRVTGAKGADADAATVSGRSVDVRILPEPARPAARVRRSPAGRPGTRSAGDGTYGSLTERIMEYFAGTGGADVRARDVAAALGRDTDAGSINAVRSTLDRLVGSSRIQRAGRGLYRANP
ncbi:hypothetical protein GCM10010145_21800 [Streptomyces ruber]|uniref:Uncharacterized protein n=2 Tax=Streptomyces TaxID=1883 RepID=A0A918EPP8_9ACTN|nr:hypothetical protein [Streptomyces ruber]GGQ52064.1 hypothetical protein GCM10010145_21800 [Streptomyces ruber]